MTDQDESRPLSRREIRLREMAAAGVAPEETPAPQDVTAAMGSSEIDPSAEIDIPLFDETGRQRSRRELRELREKALAERAAAQQEAEAAAEPEPAEPEPAGSEAAEPEPTEPEPVEPAAAESEAAEFEAAGSEAAEFEVEPVALEPETEAVEVEATEPELEAVESGQAPVEPEHAPVQAEPEPQTVRPEPVLAETVAFDVIADQRPEPANDFASLLHEIAVENAAESTSGSGEPEVVAPSEGAAQPWGIPEPRAAVATELPAEAVAEPEAQAEAAAEPAPEAEVEAQPPVAPSQAYSFPDIAPLDEGHSIFDDPALRMMNAQGAQESAEPGGGRDFDDLITRAVAQEGAASSTNTSALILPSMPETDGLTGPLGETDELFVTGSFELPKSLSETGGHSALHDSVDADPLDDLGFAEATPTGMMAPVSASRAISARSESGALVTEATKDKSKMPVVLIATGGVLVLGAAGLIVWAAASGLFG